MNHGHLSSRLGQSSQPQQFVKRIISWVSFFVKRQNLQNLSHFFAALNGSSVLSVVLKNKSTYALLAHTLTQRTGRFNKYKKQLLKREY